MLTAYRKRLNVDYGFSFLSGRGRLVIKDVMMLAGALVLLADSAQAWLRRLPGASEPLTN